MKNLLITLLLSIATLSTAAAAGAPKASNDTVYTVTVSPVMHCVNCENKIKQNLRYERGVKSIAVDRRAQTVTLRVDKTKANLESLAQGFARIGYTITPAQPAAKQ